MKLTRRQLVVATGSAAAVKALAQSGAATPGPAEFEQQARDNVQRNGEALAKFPIPQSVEPAFQFKA